MPRTYQKPTKLMIGQLAERAPSMLNPVVAFFVFEWQSVVIDAGSVYFGLDQAGCHRMIPDYVGLHGVDWAVSLLLMAPDRRDSSSDPALISVCCAREFVVG